MEKMSDTCDIAKRERDKDKFFFEDRTTLTYTHTNYFLLCPMQLYYLIDRIWQAKCY